MQTHHSGTRHGITLIEVLVLIAIAVMLLSLILPSINTGHVQSRDVQCINNLRNLGLAIQTRASLENQKLPYLIDETDSPGVSWPKKILAQIGESSALRHDNYTGVINVFTCSDDVNNFEKPGALSYRANSGYTGVYNTNSDPRNEWSLDNYRRSGVMFPSRVVRVRITLDEVNAGDGVSNTLLLGERSDVAVTYVGTRNLGFGLTFSAMSGTAFNTVDVDRNATGNVGTAPGPTSNHVGIVNVVFCDTHTASLSHSIDKSVYAKLLSHAGARDGETTLDPGY